MTYKWVEPNFDGILPELKARPNWVLAKAVLRNGKLTKPPYQPDGVPASHGNPATWSSFEAVKCAYQRGGYLGVGFVLDGQPHFDGKYLHGFDWDKCICNDVIDPEVKKVVRSINMPRLEISVSRNGLRGFFVHDELLSSRKSVIDDRSVELYGNLRYLTTTGHSFVPGQLL